jgi:hypothetical protein
MVYRGSLVVTETLNTLLLQGLFITAKLKLVVLILVPPVYSSQAPMQR